MLVCGSPPVLKSASLQDAKNGEENESPQARFHRRGAGIHRRVRHRTRETRAAAGAGREARAAACAASRAGAAAAAEARTGGEARAQARAAEEAGGDEPRLDRAL